MSATCVECGRVFDLLSDGAELAYGHDCETSPEAYTIYDLPYYSLPEHVVEELL